MAKSLLLKKEATEIAKKLGALVEKDGPHQNASFYYDGMLIFEFGIRHGRKSGHGHLCGENSVLRMSETRALSFARCQFSKDEYVELLREKGVIPKTLR